MLGQQLLNLHASRARATYPKPKPKPKAEPSVSYTEKQTNILWWQMSRGTPRVGVGGKELGFLNFGASNIVGWKVKQADFYYNYVYYNCCYCHCHCHCSCCCCCSCTKVALSCNANECQQQQQQHEEQHPALL